MENLAVILTRLIASHGLTSAELARRTGIAQPVIYRLMSGETINPQVLTLKPIADYFKISIDQLLGFVSPSKNHFSDMLIHDMHNKLVTIRTIASVLADILPKLLLAYQNALSADIIEEEISKDILPLLEINTYNLLTAANQIQETLRTE